MSKKFFTFDFPEALAILLHEWGYIRGYDGSRSITDTLTKFTASIIREREALNQPENEWRKISAEIRRQNPTETSGVYDYVDCLTSDEKSNLLKSVPEDELFQMLKNADLL